MKKMMSCVVAILIAMNLLGQSNPGIKVISAGDKQPLAGATISIPGQKKHLITDSAGIALLPQLPEGKHKVHISFMGFEEKAIYISIPTIDSLIEAELQIEEEEEEEVIVRSTRTSRTIKNVPTRVETIDAEEIDEKVNMRPANVSMLLHESTGIQVQQTSATSGNASIRIQGLDGRYTQLLKDGFASFGNFASGLSVLEIPPLDLKQVEIIKGPASTLYGGGAIAGVVNFISKTPQLKPENSFILNQSSIGQTNAGYFSSGKGKKAGYTLLALYNRQQLYDVDKDDFTEVPKSWDFTIHPKLFLYPSATTVISVGNSLSMGQREGGDVHVIKGKADNYHRYFEENNTVRNITTLELDKQLSGQRSLTVKQSLSVFDRHINIPDYHFDGISYNSFTDIAWLTNRGKHSIVTGLNLIYDNFNEKAGSADNRDNENLSTGAYIQDTWDISELVKLESGLRLDWARFSNTLFSKSEFFALPRVSLLVRYNNKLSSRVGGGMGYKLPTLFTEQTETMQYQGVQQLNNVKSERSYGATADLDFKTKIGEAFQFSINQLFFYSWITRPLVLNDDGMGKYSFSNSTEPVQSKGFETNAKLIYKQDFKLFLGYTFTDAKAKYLLGNQFMPLVPKHKFNSALIYEKHDFLKLGLEAYYTSPQYLNNGSRTVGFWEMGFMAEKPWEKFSIFINFENFTDTRQSRYKGVANDPHNNPTFDDIWTHTEGFVINGGIKLRL